MKISIKVCLLFTFAIINSKVFAQSNMIAVTASPSFCSTGPVTITATALISPAVTSGCVWSMSKSFIPISFCHEEHYHFCAYGVPGCVPGVDYSWDEFFEHQGEDNDRDGENYGGAEEKKAAKIAAVTSDPCYSVGNIITLDFPYSGEYTFTCIYTDPKTNTSTTYYSNPITIIANVESNPIACGDYYNNSEQASFINSQMSISTCTTGLHVLGFEKDSPLTPGALYLKASHAINLNPGFYAGYGSLVQTKIGVYCEDSFFRLSNEQLPDDPQSNNSQASDLNWSVYPNPSSGKFSIAFSSPGKTGVDVFISNMLGEEIYRTKLQSQENSEIDLSSQKAGIYLVKLIANNKITYQQLVINN